MKILIVSFYYRPDLSAGSFRATALVEALRGTLPAGSTIDVVTTLPNRYHSFAADAPEHEQRGEVSVTRIALPAHRSGMLDQSRAFLRFARATTREVKGRRYDLVFATSSRLMTAVLAAGIARRARARLYLDLRDIFVDTIKDVAPPLVARLTKPLFAMMEQWVVGRADRVNLVSRGFARYFEPRYPRRKFSYFSNGIDEEFLDVRRGPPAAAPSPSATRPLLVLYAGNIGEGQGLHAIVPELARRTEGRMQFRIVGDSGRRRALEQSLVGSTNVELRAPVARDELVALYRSADVLFLHLNDYEAFEKVLPSKLFEYAAMGKPVWAGVAGFAAEFIRAEIENAVVFPPCDVDAALQSFATLAITDTPRDRFLAKYARASISRAMAAEIVAVAGE